MQTQITKDGQVKYEASFDKYKIMSRIKTTRPTDTQKIYRNLGQLEFCFRLIDKDWCVALYAKRSV